MNTKCCGHLALADLHHHPKQYEHLAVSGAAANRLRQTFGGGHARRRQPARLVSMTRGFGRRKRREPNEVAGTPSTAGCPLFGYWESRCGVCGQRTVACLSSVVVPASSPAQLDLSAVTHFYPSSYSPYTLSDTATTYVTPIDMKTPSVPDAPTQRRSRIIWKILDTLVALLIIVSVVLLWVYYPR